MKKIFTLFLMALSLSAFAQKKVAVYMTGNDPVNEIVGNRLVDGLAKNGQYTAIERSASFLKALSKEHSYEREGAVDDNEIAELGRQFGVQYVCVASVLDVWRNEKYITARIIDAESAEVVATGSSNGSITNPKALVGAMNGLSESLLKTLDYNKSASAKKVAVYVSRTGNRDVDIILGDQLVAGFARSGKYLAIERTNSFLAQLSKEQGYQQSGAVDDEDLIRLAKQFGVQYVCAAKTTAWGGSYFISARLINVSTAEIVNSYNAEDKQLGNSQNVVAVASEMAEKLSGNTIKEEEDHKKAEELRKARVGRPWTDLLMKLEPKAQQKSNDYFWYGSGGSDDGFYLTYYYNNKIELNYIHYTNRKRLTGSGEIATIFLNEKELYRRFPNAFFIVSKMKRDFHEFDPVCDYARMYDKNGKLIYDGSIKKDGYPAGAYPCSNNFYEWAFKTINYDSGDKYVGETKKGKRCGWGLYIWENGTVWFGKWDNGKRNGIGKLIKPDGSYEDGTWRDDKKVD